MKWRFPLGAGGLVVALVLAVLGFSLIDASDRVKRQNLSLMFLR